MTERVSLGILSHRADIVHAYLKGDLRLSRMRVLSRGSCPEPSLLRQPQVCIFILPMHLKCEGMCAAKMKTFKRSL